jgi:D-alanyl-lipoteichoic acid acyltransferase DltB (MBOAT superfamily)
VSGFWHGANWTFIIWGALNAIYFLPLLLSNKNRTNTDTIASGKKIITFKEGFQLIKTFTLTIFAWIFFRASNVREAFNYIKSIFDISIFEIPNTDLKPCLYIFILMFVEWFQREKEHGLELSKLKITPLRWLIYIFVFCMILFFGANSESFIYFQF